MKIIDKLGNLMRTLTGRRERRTDREIPIATTAEAGRRVQAGPARHPRRDADIPLDRIEQTYTPTQTSLKAPFRSNGYKCLYLSARWRSFSRTRARL